MLQPLSSSPVFPNTDEGTAKLVRLLQLAVLPEYGLVPLFYALGWFQQFHLALTLQLAFVGASGAVQYWVFRDGWHGQDSLLGGERYEELQVPLNSVLGIPVRRCQDVVEKVVGQRIPRALYEFVLQLPNYIHVQQTAVVAASSWITWSPALGAEFAQRWEDFPPFGWLGLPGLLTLAIAVTCALHLACAFCLLTGHPEEVADAANLLFLGQSLSTGSFKRKTGVGMSRLLASVTGKVPMLWLKVSLLTLTWQCMDAQQRGAMLLAIALAWYSLVPAMRAAQFVLSLLSCAETCRERDFAVFSLYYFPAIGLLAMLAVVLLHMLGLPLCKSDDFSVFHGCTPPIQAHLCSNSTR